MNEADLLDAIARRVDDPEPYLAYAAWLDTAKDPRGELVRLQLALETAKGEAAVALREKERAWLLAHREHLFGPFAPLVASDVDKKPGFRVFVWSRGFLTRIALDRIPKARPRNPADPPDGIVRLSAAEVARGLLHPVARHCRALDASTWPRRLPPGVEQVRIHEAVITPRLLAEPALRTLELGAVVGGEPLVHAGLETLKLPCDAAGVDLLASSELPALKRLVCRDIVPDPALLTRLASAIAKLGAIDVEVAFLVSNLRPFSELHVGPDAVAALRPVADRIVALSVPADTYGAVTELDWDLELPRLARLDVCGCPSARSLRAPAWRTIHELSLSRAVDSRALDTSVAALCESGIAPQLRCLRVFFEARDQPDAVRTLAAQPFDRLEELVLHCGIKSRPQLDLFGGIPENAFPALRRVEVPTYDLASFARSTLAPHIERLAIDVSPAEIDRLPAPIAEIVRERFPRAELAPRSNHSRTYWTDERGALPSQRSPPPQMAGWSRPAPAPDLSAFPGLAEMWSRARDFPEMVAAVLPSRTSAPPKPFQSFASFAADLKIDLDYPGLLALAPAARLACVEGWRQRFGDAIAARHGQGMAPLFSLGASAEAARHELGTDPERPPTEPVNARRFLLESASLAEPLRSELAEVRAWCQLIANQHTFPSGAEGALDPSAYARVLAGPFVERDPSIAPPPAEPKQLQTTFETATRDHVVRRVIRHWVELLLAQAGGDAMFEGGLESGFYVWDNRESASFALAWNEHGVVAFAADIYGTGDNTERDAKSILGKVPRPIRPIADALAERREYGLMSAMWIAPAARHRYPSEGNGSGFEHLTFFLSDTPVRAPCDARSHEREALGDALAKQILGGGGALTDEQCALLDTQPDGQPRHEIHRNMVAAALEKLGLHRAKASPKPRAKPRPRSKR